VRGVMVNSLKEYLLVIKGRVQAGALFEHAK
jgi:hypothetical protein